MLTMRRKHTLVQMSGLGETMQSHCGVPPPPFLILMNGFHVLILKVILINSFCHLKRSVILSLERLRQKDRVQNLVGLQ